MTVMRTAYKLSFGNPKENRTHDTRRRRWEDNIKIDLTEIVLEGLEWIHVVQDRDQWVAFVNTIINFRFHERRGIS
jgi:hypothetical protein